MQQGTGEEHLQLGGLRRVAFILAFCSSAFLGTVAFGLTPEVEVPRVEPVVAGLAATSYGERFDAALSLLDAEGIELEAIVSDAIDVWRAAGAAAPAAAGEFVLHKLRGRDIPPESGRRALPDVVLVSIDTLRVDHLHCYGYALPTSPTLDSLAAGGVLFENAISPSSWTLPVHMSMFTSLYPSFHKVDRAGRLGSIKLDGAVPTVPELLKKQGYVTAGFAANGYLNPMWGFGRGFDFYREYVTDAKAQLQRAALWVEWHSFHRRLGLASEPLFLFVHLLDPHGAGDNLIFLGEGVEAKDPRYRIAMYDGQIHFVDSHLKKFLDTLDSLNTLESTLTVITSDHGEELGDHGGFGHKNTLYEEQLRVPLIVSYPARVRVGRRISGQVSLLDIAPTILELLGEKPPDSFQGTSLVAHLQDKDARARVASSRILFAELHPIDFAAGSDFYIRAARGERYKLIVTRFQDGRTTKELYDLSGNPAETKNLYDEPRHSAAQASLEERLDDFMRRAAGYRPDLKEKNRIDLDSGIRERLRALGYEE